MNYNEMSLKLHEENKGKMEIALKCPLENKDDLSTAYTPGVAQPCIEIHNNPDDAYKYTLKQNTVAVVSDGTAVLGLGDIGPLAAIPVMEGKSVLFKRFGNVDAFPLCIKSNDVDTIVDTIALLEGSFGGVNLEDISAPRCFEIEKKLKERCSIPIFHDDQHGTAVVVLAGIINALKLVDKKIEDIEVVVSGAGAAGIAITKLLMQTGLKNVILCDRTGAIYEGRDNLNPVKEEMAKVSNRLMKKGGLADVIEGVDVFIGVSGPGILTKEMVAKMADKPIIFAMSNPVPEITPEEAKEAGVAIMATGRSDYPNQINNVLAFPGIFRGALDVRASDINEEMKLAAAYAIAGIVTDEDRSAEYIIPDSFNKKVTPAVAKAVAAVMKNPAALQTAQAEFAAQTTFKKLRNYLWDREWSNYQG